MEHINPVIKKRRKTRIKDEEGKGNKKGRVVDKKGLEVLLTISNSSDMVKPDVIGKNADDF